jgi:hypothetical protein
VSLTALAEHFAAEGWQVDRCSFNGAPLVTATRGVLLVSVLEHRGSWLVMHGAGRAMVGLGDLKAVQQELQR